MFYRQAFIFLLLVARGLWAGLGRLQFLFLYWRHFLHACRHNRLPLPPPPLRLISVHRHWATLRFAQCTSPNRMAVICFTWSRRRVVIVAFKKKKKKIQKSLIYVFFFFFIEGREPTPSIWCVSCRFVFVCGEFLVSGVCVYRFFFLDEKSCENFAPTDNVIFRRVCCCCRRCRRYRRNGQAQVDAEKAAFGRRRSNWST